jgi:hypothetical protein
VAESTVIFTGRLVSLANHGSIVILLIEDEQGHIHSQNCDHRQGWAIWEDLQDETVEVCEDEDGTVFIRAA